MGRSEWIFLTVLIINTIIAIVYFVWAVLFRNKNEYDENRRFSHMIRAVCIFLCPVVGLLFFLVGLLFRNIFFRSAVDLSDVIFNKEKVRSVAKADEEQEKNIVPIQEALAVSDFTQMRRLMLNVLKGDISNSLSSIALALDSEDSETSHYAASVLSKSLNEFRVTVRKLDQEIHNEENDENKQNECCVMLLEYMNQVLMQRVFTDVEQRYFVQMMSDTGELLYQHQLEEQRQIEEARIQAEKAAAQQAAEQAAAQQEKENAITRFIGKGKQEKQEEEAQFVLHIWMKPEHYASIALRLTELAEYDTADIWCTRAMEQYPQELASYRCRMQLLFAMEKKQEFLEVLGSLRRSGVAIDNETLEMIRVFQ